MANDPRIDDMAEAVQILAGAISSLAGLLSDDPERLEQVVAVRRLAAAAERLTERVLLGA
jgi:hypothetical protein